MVALSFWVHQYLQNKPDVVTSKLFPGAYTKGRQVFLESWSTFQSTPGDRLHVRRQTILPLEPHSGDTTKGQTSLRGDPGEGLFAYSLFLGSFPKGMPDEYKPSSGTHLIVPRDSLHSDIKAFPWILAVSTREGLKYSINR